MAKLDETAHCTDKRREGHIVKGMGASKGRVLEEGGEGRRKGDGRENRRTLATGRTRDFLHSHGNTVQQIICNTRWGIDDQAPHIHS